MRKYNNECLNELLCTDENEWTFEKHLHKESETDKVEYLFSYNGFSFCAKENLQMLCGAEKSGKTTIISNLICAVLFGECGGVVCNVENAKVLLCDTEQGHSEITDMKKYIRNVCGNKYSNEKFAVRDLASVESLEELKQDIWQSIEYFKPDIVIVDCCTDLVEDTITSEKECKNIVAKEKCIAIKNKCSILNVVHFRPTTTQPRGHLGAELKRKVTDNLTAELVTLKNGTQINKISFADKRGRRGQKTPIIKWVWNEELKPQIFTEDIETNKGRKAK